MVHNLDDFIRKLAQGRCEYCRIPESHSRLGHVLDHIIARQHGGLTTTANLALCCGRCNQFKGPNIAGIDPESSQLVRLFNPRLDLWDEHFRFKSAYLVGLTPVGKATIAVLAINLPIRIASRRSLLDAGHPL